MNEKPRFQIRFKNYYFDRKTGLIQNGSLTCKYTDDIVEAGHIATAWKKAWEEISEREDLISRLEWTVQMMEKVTRQSGEFICYKAFETWKGNNDREKKS